MKIHVHETPCDIGGHLAGRIVAGIGEAKAEGRPYVLGCPGGRSPMPVYQALALRVAEEQIDCSRLIIVMMDEYLLTGADGALAPPPEAAHFSCRGFGMREILGRINAALPESFRMPAANLWMPDLELPIDYDGRIAAIGGIDLFLLASGAGDGHIAFNPPGSARDSASRVVELNEQTRRDNLATFPDFQSLDDVPKHGLSIGIASIAGLSSSVAMIVWGEGKRLAYRRISDASGYDPSWPATIVTECRTAELHCDRSAAGE